LVHVGEDYPNPLTTAGIWPLVPGMKNNASVRLLSTGVKRRNGLKVVKMTS
jgi:hypothetical protein